MIHYDVAFAILLYLNPNADIGITYSAHLPDLSVYTNTDASWGRLERTLVATPSCWRAPVSPLLPTKQAEGALVRGVGAPRLLLRVQGSALPAAVGLPWVPHKLRLLTSCLATSLSLIGSADES